MRLILAPLALALVLLSIQTAHAQEPAPAKKMALGASVVILFPQGDADELAGTSPAVRPQFVYWVHPMVGVVASFDWVFVSENDGVPDITYYDISVGARVTSRSAARLKPFGEILVGRHTLEIDAADYSESDIGFRLGGGGTYELGGALQGIGQVTYSTVSIDNADIDAFALEAGLLARF